MKRVVLIKFRSSPSVKNETLKMFVVFIVLMGRPKTLDVDNRARIIRVIISEN